MPEQTVCESITTRSPSDGASRGRRRSAGASVRDGSKRLLVIDDDRRRASDTARWLCGRGWHASAVADGASARKRLERERFAGVIVDSGMMASPAMSFVRLVRGLLPDLAIISTSGRIGGSCEQLIQEGADAVVHLPATDAEMFDGLNLAMARRHAGDAVQGQSLSTEQRSAIARTPETSVLIGDDPLIQSIRDVSARVASTRATVLVTGESGTGKSLVAREIHRLGNRRSHPFVEVACGALSDQLLESELFGHAAGAFTGATAAYAGRFLQADGGTIFLDEIGTASPAMQVKLLRVLQDRSFEPVGAGVTRQVDVRLILATNEDLARRVVDGTFREDLYWRINVITIRMPTLRDRISDLPQLATRFAVEAARDAGRDFEGFREDAIRKLLAHPWPGNIRELRHAVERAIYLGSGSVITSDDLVIDAASGFLSKRWEADQATDRTPSVSADSLRKSLEEPERRLILEALARSGGCRRDAARALGINRTSLYRKFKRLGIDPSRPESTGNGG
ncbi:MAG: sigma-54-dependent transcriptional regulator [Planctomycetaceae bacterium]